MHAYIALALALASPALVAAVSRDRIGYEREIDATRFNQVPQLHDFILSDEYLAGQKNRGKLITRPRPDESIASDDVILESKLLRVVRPATRNVRSDGGGELVRRRRGYNLENVRVPSRYPYLPVPSYSRFRRWG